MASLIERTAAEIAAQEGQIRRMVAGFIQQGRGEEAIAILEAWDHMAPGDVLRKYGSVEHGKQN